MRDMGGGGDKSNHRSHHKHSNNNNASPGNGSNNAKLFADIKSEATRGLELLDKIVNDAAQAKWILKTVLTNVADIESGSSKCQNCTPPQPSKKESTAPQSTSSKDKRDKKAKKAVLPMVSGHTVHRPTINITRVDAQRSTPPVEDPPRRRPGPSSKTANPVKRSRDSSDERRGKKEARSSRGEEPRRRDSATAKKPRKSRISSSSSSSGSRSSSSSSSSSSGSSSSGSRAKEHELLSVGGSSHGSRGNRKDKKGGAKSPSKPVASPKKPATSSVVSASPSPQRPSPQHGAHGSASSRFLTSTQNVDRLRRQHIKKNLRVGLKDVTRLLGTRKSLLFSSVPESQIREYCPGYSRPKPPKPAPPKIGPKSRMLPKVESPKEATPEEDPDYRPPTPKAPLPQKKLIGPKSKMAAIKCKEEDKRPKVVTPQTTAEALRAKLREKFNKFKMSKLAANGGGSSGSAATLPDSTTSVKIEKAGSSAGHQELAAIGLSVFVSAGEKKSHNVDEIVGKGMDGGRGSELLEMKRDHWILMQNNVTGISSLRDDVNKGLKRVVGWDLHDDGQRDSPDDEDGHYLVGNFYFIAREGHPLALMRYVGGSQPPCDADNEDSTPPKGFVPVDLTSLTASQLSELQVLGSPRKPSPVRRSISVDSQVKKRVESSSDDDDEPIKVPEIKFGSDDDGSDLTELI